MSLREPSVLVVLGWVLLGAGCLLGAYGVHRLTRGGASHATSGTGGAAPARSHGWSTVFSGLILIGLAIGVVVRMPEWALVPRIAFIGLCAGMLANAMLKGRRSPDPAGARDHAGRV